MPPLTCLTIPTALGWYLKVLGGGGCTNDWVTRGRCDETHDVPSWTQASGETAWGFQDWKSLEFQPGPSPSSSCPFTHLSFGFSIKERKGAESLLWVISQAPHSRAPHPCGFQVGNSAPHHFLSKAPS